MSNPDLISDPFALLENPENDSVNIACEISTYVINTCQVDNPHNDSNYKEFYCGDLIRHMSHGLSFDSFGGVVNKRKKILDLWVKDYVEFRHAKELGEQKNLLFWEVLFTLQAKGRHSGNIQAVIHKLKNLNPDNHKDKTEINVTGQVQWVLDSGIRRSGDQDFNTWLERDDQNKHAIEAEFNKVEKVKVKKSLL